MRFLVLFGLLLWTQCRSAQTVITQCEQVTTQFDCNYHAYDRKHCMWQNNKCQGISQCSDITIQSGCVRAPLSFAGCNWDLNFKTCYKPTEGDCMLATTQAACVNKAGCLWMAGNPGSCNLPTQCGQISAQAVCDDSTVGTTSCQWNQNTTQCVAITDCASIVTQARCNLSKLNYNSVFQYCQWTGATCGKITQCSEAVDQTNCGFVIDAFPGGCKWEASITKCVIKDPTSCSQISYSSICSASTLGCQWANSQCSPRPTACTQILNQTDCQASTLPTPCWWKPDNTCATITACTQIINQALCNSTPAALNLSCGWHTWGAVAADTNVAIPQGVPASPGNGICGPNTTVCTDMVDPVNQCASGDNLCYWTSNAATPPACTGDTRQCVDAPGVCSGGDVNSCKSGHPECDYDYGPRFCYLVTPCAGQTRSDCFARTNICLWQ